MVALFHAVVVQLVVAAGGNAVARQQLGFLRGVDFFWTTTHLFGEALFASGIVLAVFFAVDSFFYKKESDAVKKLDKENREPFRIHGGCHVFACFQCGHG